MRNGKGSRIAVALVWEDNGFVRAGEETKGLLNETKKEDQMLYEDDNLKGRSGLQMLQTGCPHISGHQRVSTMIGMGILSHFAVTAPRVTSFTHRFQEDRATQLKQSKIELEKRTGIIPRGKTKCCLVNRLLSIMQRYCIKSLLCLTERLSFTFSVHAYCFRFSYNPN